MLIRLLGLQLPSALLILLHSSVLRLMEIPELSIIVPAHNAGGYLQETIESVRALKGIKWECLIINDQSTDGRILESFE